MLEILYRIYEVPDEETAKRNLESDHDFGLYSSTSKACNIELLMDCMVCETRDQFKELIRLQYGEKIAFRYSRNLKEGDLYCIIIGEHCYNADRYFNKVQFSCDFCGASVETYYGRGIGFSNSEIRYSFYGIQGYASKRFCSERCKHEYKQIECSKLRPEDYDEFYVSRDMFTEQIAGYIYKITKKSTGHFYVGQTKYAPVFRWGEHLKTDRFPISDIADYMFEVLEIVPTQENILEREAHWIKTLSEMYPQTSLNIVHVPQNNRAP